MAGLLLVLMGGLAYRQLLHSGDYAERAKRQSERRLLVPGPRGTIYDREGRVLVGNRPRFSVVLYLAELRGEFRKEEIAIHKAYVESEKDGDLERSDRPNPDQIRQIARSTVVTRYLDQANAALGREEKLDSKDLEKHYKQQLLLPYVLIDDLRPEEYARLVEQLPVKSPVQVYTSSTRSYPFGSSAAHALGYIKETDEPAPEEFPGDELKTFSLKSTTGATGLELKYDNLLQGETGGAIYRVDPAGFKIEPPIEKRTPRQGKDLTLSLDIDLQRTAEEALDGLNGSAVALDVKTGEILALTVKPDYDLNLFARRISKVEYDDIVGRGALFNRALQGAYAPGSTFKIITTIAGMHAGTINLDSKAVCSGFLKVGNRIFHCDARNGHGEENLVEAVRDSCDVYYYTYGILTGPDKIAAEARRFGLGRPEGFELGETKGVVVPDPEWKKKMGYGVWQDGDTANYSIGQGYPLVTPLQMACVIASVARGETITKPTLIHDTSRPLQHSEPIGITPAQYNALLTGLEQVVSDPHGTAYQLGRVPGVRVAGKTGTAQRAGKGDIGWFVAFAPVEHPEIAIAVAVEGDTNANQMFAGGLHSAPVAKEIFVKYFEKKAQREAEASRNKVVSNEPLKR